MSIFKQGKASQLTYGVKGAFYENFRPTKTWPTR